MAKKTTVNKQVIYRSAETGRFVTQKYATAHPNTTIRQTVSAIPVPPKPKKKAHKK